MIFLEYCKIQSRSYLLLAQIFYLWHNHFFSRLTEKAATDAIVSQKSFVPRKNLSVCQTLKVLAQEFSGYLYSNQK